MITDDDEREARELDVDAARDAATCNDYLQVHQRVTDAIWESQTRCDDPEEHAAAALDALKAAGVKFDLTTPSADAARDAALEEAADIIEDSRGEIEENDDGRSAAVDEHCLFLIDRIRALRRPA